MRIAREEIFGPVISTIAFDSEDEGLAIANDTNDGLHASVYTNDLDTAIRAARTLRAGTVSVHAYSEGDITTPFGGYKESGFGGRDKGLAAIDQYISREDGLDLGSRAEGQARVDPGPSTIRCNRRRSAVTDRRTIGPSSGPGRPYMPLASPRIRMLACVARPSSIGSRR